MLREYVRMSEYNMNWWEYKICKYTYIWKEKEMYYCLLFSYVGCLHLCCAVSSVFINFNYCIDINYKYVHMNKCKVNI